MTRLENKLERILENQESKIERVLKKLDNHEFLLQSLRRAVLNGQLDADGLSVQEHLNGQPVGPFSPPDRAFHTTVGSQRPHVADSSRILAECLNPQEEGSRRGSFLGDPDAQPERNF